VSLGDLPQALALAAVALDWAMVQFEPIAADVAAFEACAPHAGAHPLDDQVAFEFGNGADDNHDGTAQRSRMTRIFRGLPLPTNLKSAHLSQKELRCSFYSLHT